MTADKIPAILTACIDITAQFNRQEVLTALVNHAKQLANASYAAFEVLDSHGEAIEFYSSGTLPISATDTSPSSILPHFATQLNNIPFGEAIVLNQMNDPKHKEIRHFLGMLVSFHQQFWGRLYLLNRRLAEDNVPASTPDTPLTFSPYSLDPHGFNTQDHQAVELLAKSANVAIENSRRYAEAENRSRWLNASQKIVSSLLEGSEEEEALQVITEEMRLAAPADIALMILPSINDTWMCEIGAGEGAQELIGVHFPKAGRARTVIQEQAGVVIDSMQRLSTVRVKELRQFGPALYAPLVSQGVGRGVIVLFRRPGAREFDLHDLSMAENVAKQATIALELAEARQAQELASELDERARISRDLHDLAIQQLFASGMHITAVKEDLQENLTPEISRALDNAIWAIDESVGQIRKIVQSLRDNSSPAAVIERLQHENQVALQLLGFAPSLLINWNGKAIASDFDYTLIDDAIGSDIADDVVAVVREGLSNAARHARAASVTVEINVDLTQIQVLVKDDGAGITPSLSRRSGLSNLAARARRHHGTFSMRPRADGHSGTELHWKVPLR